MNICFIGKHKYPKDIFSNELDMKTWRSLAIYFENLFIIAQSPDLFCHCAKEKNIKIYLLPNFLGYFGFIAGAIWLGLYLNYNYRVNAFDASEIVGGGIVTTILRVFTGIPAIIEIQGETFGYYENKNKFKDHLLKKIGRFVIKRAARIRVISNAIFNQVEKQRVNKNIIRLIPLRVDLNLFNPISFYLMSDIGQKVDKMGITLGYIGRLVSGKGLEDLFEAIKILKNQDSELSSWNLVVYGIGSLELKLKKMAKDFGIEDKIKWHGFAPYSKVPEALSKIDIFIYPSLHEGFGRSIMEALAMEKAVIATNVGGIPDLISNGKNGFLVEPNNPKVLAEKIKELIKNKNLREEFGKNGRKWVSENFEWNAGIKKFANLFLELKK